MYIQRNYLYSILHGVMNTLVSRNWRALSNTCGETIFFKKQILNRCLSFHPHTIQIEKTKTVGIGDTTTHP